MVDHSTDIDRVSGRILPLQTGRTYHVSLPTWQTWLHNARPGEEFTYAYGELFRDRFMRPMAANELHKIGKATWGAHLTGEVALMQRRVLTDDQHHRDGGEIAMYEYIARKLSSVKSSDTYRQERRKAWSGGMSRMGESVASVT